MPDDQEEVLSQTTSDPNAQEQEVEDDRPILERIGMDEEIWMGGPTRSDVEKLKEQYPKCQVRLTFTTDESGVIWRTVTRSEWRDISKVVPTLDNDEKREEYIFSKIVLVPDLTTSESIDNLPAGIIPAIMQEFYLHCGFQQVAPSLKL